IMSVNPGFGGQAFIPSALRKIARARRMIDEVKSRALLEVDGGIKTDNAAEVIAAGADILVAGSAVFCGDDYAATIHALRAGHRTPTASQSSAPASSRH
ncbi:MAG TPA: ribulose-phosphate 3-epimerase, partial [Nitrospiraceae bacterium]|nr:ribulose-phosphate 3-epimerase [Nitrospiraceae bacterium]